MKDPRKHRVWSEWYIEAEEHSRMKHTPHHLSLLHGDICRRLDAKDAEIAALKQSLEEAQSELDGFGVDAPAPAADAGGPKWRCPECGDDADGCYCAKDAEARERGEGE